MKVKESFWHEAAKADKNDKTNWTADAARRPQTTVEQTNHANRNRQNDATAKEETKFANLLESSAKLQKTNQRHEDEGGENGEERKKDKKQRADGKDAGELAATDDDRAEKYESFGGQTGGNQSGFGAGANVSQSNLSENFAARSILHIADLERLVSTVRSQISLGGRREIVLQLKRSVLDGLQVKITTDAAARVSVNFLAASETVCSQVKDHEQELAGILRGRGINLTSLTTSLDTRGENQNSARGDESDVFKINPTKNTGEDPAPGNTFGAPDDASDKIYQA